MWTNPKTVFAATVGVFLLLLVALPRGHHPPSESSTTAPGVQVLLLLQGESVRQFETEGEPRTFSLASGPPFTNGPPYLFIAFNRVTRKLEVHRAQSCVENSGLWRIDVTPLSEL